MKDKDFGSCCSCGVIGPSVRNVMTLPFKSPPGPHGEVSGWGCGVCHLPAVGATAVLCDRCFDGKKRAKLVVVGWPGMNVRMPLAEAKLAPKHDHDELYHPEIMEERIRKDIGPKKYKKSRSFFGPSSQ